MDERKQSTGAKKFVVLRKGRSVRRLYLRIIALTSPIVGVLGISTTGWANDPALNPGEVTRERAKGMAFDAHFLHGEKVDLSLFEQGNPAAVGDYPVSILVNNQQRGRFVVSFIQQPEQPKGYAQPCFTLEMLQKIGIVIDKTSSDTTQACRPLEQWIPTSRAYYESSDFTLQLSVPQKYFQPNGLGDIPPERWEQGSNVAFVDYNVDEYYQRTFSSSSMNTPSRSHTTLSFSSLLGINLEGWRLRYRQISRKLQERRWQYHGQSAYAEHDITVLKSQLRLGETWSSGELFDSVTFRGVQLRSDHRMLPAKLRTYTPYFTGIAETNAKVSIWQQGKLIQETSVPAGPFEIDSPTVGGYGGDYTLIIDEADGRQKVMIVPNSAPPLILNQSVLKYELDAGKINTTQAANQAYFLQANLFYGLTENTTLYTGLQVGDGYQGGAVGNAFNTRLGGMAVTANYSQVKSKPHNSKRNGSRMTLAYNKSLRATQTSINFSFDRLTSGHYQSLNTVVNGQESYRNWGYPTVKQRMSLSVGQPIGESFSVNLSASHYRFKNKSSTKQYSLSVNNQFRYFGLGGFLSRSQTQSGVNENSLMISLSIPLGASTEKNRLFDSFYSTYSHSNNRTTTVQNSLNGHYGDENTLVYGLGINSEKNNQEKLNHGVQGNISYNRSQGQYSSSFSRNRRHQQFSLSANGSLVAHSAGLIAGRQIGNNPFAIIYAEGAQGAKIINGQGAALNREGYGLLPSLTPYLENRIAVNPEGLPLSVSIEENETMVVPRMGAAIKVKMKTQTGTPILLKIRDRQQRLFAMMSQLYTDSNPSVALVSQAGRAFVQGWNPATEALFIRDSVSHEVCQIKVSEQFIDEVKRSRDEMIYQEVSCK
ncbi:fimbria/pilus outer membrane usher protein [Rosenbergiella australiborealis]|uniref:fimbria/pilus outer membrane usher protein n=1 Tax=Rosenbergiella australiborealis TaxID=1544696 RepID=UPI001F4DCEAF|nr:fimbria/pilus outer membrane usher protein [Rosenbergiella australiborealis]